MIRAALILLILQHLLKAISDFKNIEREIMKYNRADTVNMTPAEMNKFRHIAASAYFVSNGYPDYEVELLGHIKEIKDFCRKFNWTDSDFDIENNKTGIKIGGRLKHRNKKEIFDYVFKTEIEPKRRR